MSFDDLQFSGFGEMQETEKLFCWQCIREVAVPVRAAAPIIRPVAAAAPADGAAAAAQAAQPSAECPSCGLRLTRNANQAPAGGMGGVIQQMLAGMNMNYEGAAPAEMMDPAMFLNPNMAQMAAAQQNVDIEAMMQQMLSGSGSNAPPTSDNFMRTLLEQDLTQSDFVHVFLAVDGLKREVRPTCAQFGGDLIALHDWKISHAQLHLSAPLVAIEPAEGTVPFSGAAATKGAALLKRGKISFVDKSRNVQQAGAVLSLISQVGDVWPYVATDSAKTGGDVKVPVLMVSEKDGEALNQLIAHRKLATRVSASAAAAVAEGGAAAAASSAPAAQAKPGSASAAQASAEQKHAASSSSSSSTPMLRLFTGERKLACPICRDDYEVGSKAVKLPCQHFFCKECVLQWIKKHNTCPMCRFALPTDVKSDADAAARRRHEGGDPNVAQLHAAMWN